MNLQHVFVEEAEELITELENALMELENAPETKSLIDRVFRAMHTIKGSGAMFGFDTIASFTHHIETAYDFVREGRIPVNKRLIDLTLEASDQIKRLLDSSSENESPDTGQLDGIVSEFQLLMPTHHNDPQTLSNETQNQVDTQFYTNQTNSIFRIRFRPHVDIFSSGPDPGVILEELRGMGNITIVPQTENIPPLDKLDLETCYLFWDIILTTQKPMDAIRDAFIFVEGKSDVTIHEICRSNEDSEDIRKRIGEILVERGDISPSQIDAILKKQKKFGEILVESGLVSSPKIESALKEQLHLSNNKANSTSPSIRVPADRLDHLINLVGELVITQARLSQVAGTVNNVDLMNPIEVVERLTGDLRDCVLNIRMLQIGTTFSRFRLLVRDLSSELGKEIRLITEGGETELDKTVLERLVDPLVHMIRNSIDHGIELPQERETAGKPRQGTIRLIAEHIGGNVVITIADDGKGIDPETIETKAIEKGLINTESKTEASDMYKFIFAPGFSTSTSVSNISGRGVGMDVVKRTIDDMRGSISISSRKMKGTTFSITLPLTLAIIDGLLVRVEQERFVVPLALVEECVGLSESDIAKAHNSHVMYVRNELLPYVRMREIFSISGPRPAFEQIAVVHADGQRIGIVVDEIIGDHQAVIKSLGRIYQNAAGISGATILGDGGIALIIDIPGLVQCAVEHAEDNHTSGSRSIRSRSSHTSGAPMTSHENIGHPNKEVMHDYCHNEQ